MKVPIIIIIYMYVYYTILYYIGTLIYIDLNAI